MVPRNKFLLQCYANWVNHRGTMQARCSLGRAGLARVHLLDAKGAGIIGRVSIAGSGGGTAGRTHSGGRGSSRSSCDNDRGSSRSCR